MMTITTSNDESQMRDEETRIELINSCMIILMVIMQTIYVGPLGRKVTCRPKRVGQNGSGETGRVKRISGNGPQANRVKQNKSGDTDWAIRVGRHGKGDAARAIRPGRYSQGDTAMATRPGRHGQGDLASAMWPGWSASRACWAGSIKQNGLACTLSAHKRRWVILLLMILKLIDHAVP